MNESGSKTMIRTWSRTWIPMVEVRDQSGSSSSTGLASSSRSASSAALPRTAPSSSNSHLALLLPRRRAELNLSDALCLPRVRLPSVGTPHGDRVPTSLGLPLAAAVRVVHRIHRRAADRGALPSQRLRPALPTVTFWWSAFPTWPIVARQTSGTRRTSGREARPPRARPWQRAGCPSLRSAHLAAAAGLELDVVDERARRDVGERQRVARADIGLGARLDGRARAQPRRRQDVRLRAVGVVQQRDPGRPVGSYSIEATLAGTPSLRRLKSITR